MLMIILNNDSFVNYDLVSDNMQLYSHAIIMDSFVNFSYRKGNWDVSDTNDYDMIDVMIMITISLFFPQKQSLLLLIIK